MAERMDRIIQFYKKIKREASYSLNISIVLKSGFGFATLGNQKARN